MFDVSYGDIFIFVFIFVFSCIFIYFSLEDIRPGRLQRAAHASTILLFFLAFVGYTLTVRPIEKLAQMTEEKIKLEKAIENLKEEISSLGSFKKKAEVEYKRRIYRRLLGSMRDQDVEAYVERAKLKKAKRVAFAKNIEMAIKEHSENSVIKLEEYQTTPYELLDYVLGLKYRAWGFENPNIFIPKDKLEYYLEVIQLIRDHIERNRDELDKTGFDYEASYKKYDKNIEAERKRINDIKLTKNPKNEPEDFIRWNKEAGNKAVKKFTAEIIYYDNTVYQRTSDYLKKHEDLIIPND